MGLPPTPSAQTLRLMRILCPTLILAALLGSCKALPDQEDSGRYVFEETYSDDFTKLRGRAWENFFVQGGSKPKVVDGVLRLTSEDKDFGVARSMVKLRKKGYYHAISANLRLNAEEDGNYTDVAFGYVEGETKKEFSARWRITYDLATDRWKALPMIFNEDLAAVVTGSEAVVLPDVWHSYRIAFDPLRDKFSYFIDGTLHYETVRLASALNEEFEITIGNYKGGLTEVDDFYAERLEQAVHVTVDQVRASHRSPSRVEVLFSLRDVEDEPVLLSRFGIEQDLLVTVLEDSSPIDGVESPVHVHASEDLAMDLVLVLDFTASMKAAGAGTGIDVMKLAAKELIFDRAENHRVAVVEFHDNLSGDNFSTLQGFTTDKNAAWVAVRDYQPFSGFSVAWDAVHSGLSLFPSTVDLGRVKTLAFLSDGFDTSSAQTPQSVINLAVARDVSIFNVGVEDVRGGDEIDLINVSDQTGGRYYHAEQIDDLLDHFQSIDDELTGQYKAAYVTPRSNSFALTMWVKQGSHLALEPIEMTVDGAAISGDSRQGLLSMGPATTSSQTSTFFIQSQHIPRGITQLRFQFDTAGLSIIQDDITVTVQDGAVGNWTLVEETGNWYSASGDALGFGDFGTLFKVEIANVASAFDLPFTWDNSMYPSGVLFFGGNSGELVNGNWESLISIPQ